MPPNLTLLQTLARQNDRGMAYDEMENQRRMNDARLGAQLAGQALPAWQTAVGTQETAARLGTERDLTGQRLATQVSEGALDRGADLQRQEMDIGARFGLANMQESGDMARARMNAELALKRMAQEAQLAQEGREHDLNVLGKRQEFDAKEGSRNRYTQREIAGMRASGSGGGDDRLAAEIIQMYGGMAGAAMKQKAYSQTQIQQRAAEAAAWAQKAIDLYEQQRGIQMDPAKKEEAKRRMAAQHMKNLLAQEQPAAPTGGRPVHGLDD